MRRRAMLAVGGVLAAAVATSGAGCTFLIPFDEVDVEDAGPSFDGDVPEAGDATSDDANPDAGPPAFPPPCDTSFPLDQVACNPDYPRPNCAKSTMVFASYPAGHDRANDLVTCNGGPKPTCVQHCPYGCAVMPMGYADQCDDCNGRPDGTYCVKDLQGPDGRNLGLAVDCVGGRQVQAHVCGVGKCATKCPRGSPAPSCCI